MTDTNNLNNNNLHSSRVNNLALLLSGLAGKRKDEVSSATDIPTLPPVQYDKPLYNEFLVPINIHLDIDDYSINDSFMWNLKEAYITPEEVAGGMVDDLVLPSKFKTIIAEIIRDQLILHEKNLFPSDDTLMDEGEDDHSSSSLTTPISGVVIGSDISSVSSPEDHQHTTQGDNPPKLSSSTPLAIMIEDDKVVGGGEDEAGDDPNMMIVTSSTDDYPPPPPMFEPRKECLCIIQLHITIDSSTIQDQFEWDLNADESSNSPELFARVLCADLGLSREFQSAIAHSIREQLLSYRKIMNERARGISSPTYHGPKYDSSSRDDASSLSELYVGRPAITSALRSIEEHENWTPIVGPADKLAELINSRIALHGNRSDSRYRLRSLGTRISSRNKALLS